MGEVWDVIHSVGSRWHIRASSPVVFFLVEPNWSTF